VAEDGEGEHDVDDDEREPEQEKCEGHDEGKAFER
jgi:hypothetical protein